MEDFINWIVDNWQFVSSIAISVVGFILLLLKKKVKIVDGVDEFILKIIPEAIRYAEEHGGNSSVNKLSLCLDYIEALFKKQFPNTIFDFYKTFCCVQIQNVLETPSCKKYRYRKGGMVF